MRPLIQHEDTPRHTAVTCLTRKADRRQFISDLGTALCNAGLDPALTFREGDDTTSINIIGDELSALVVFAHRRRGEVPLVHWHGAGRDLRMVTKAWSSVNCFHRRKATSFPTDLNGAIDCLVAGLTAAKDRTAFLREDGQ